MNKAISINLAGIFFHMEDKAYHKLESYINALNRHFNNEEGDSEIIEDIEARIAEMFQESLKKHKRQVVLLGDVDMMIQLVGHPEEIEETVAPSGHLNFTGATRSSKQKRSKTKYKTYQNMYQTSKMPYRRFYRNDEDKILGGVCSGIAAYFGVHDPLWVRLAFAVAVFLGFGAGIPIYILLWIVIPTAKTPLQKMAMRGEEINLENIERSVKDRWEDVKEDFQEVTDRYKNGEGSNKTNS